MKNISKFFLIICFIFIANINGCNANTNNQKANDSTSSIKNIYGFGRVKIKPDFVNNTFEFRVEDQVLSTASDKNAQIMNEFKNFLIGLGVEEKHINTKVYNTRNFHKQIPNGNVETFYNTYTKLSIPIPAEKIYEIDDIMKDLEIEELKPIYRENENVVERFSLGFYSNSNKTANDAKNIAKSKQEKLIDALKNIGISDLQLLDFRTQIDKKDLYDTEEMFEVVHSYQIKISTSIDISKILKKCEDLGITYNREMEYEISDELFKKSKLNAYENAMSDAREKAEALLRDQKFQIGNFSVVDLTDQSNNSEDQAADEYAPTAENIVIKEVYIEKLNGDMHIENVEIKAPDIPFAHTQESELSVLILTNFEIIKN
ncbi:SIMPL domain-containing protein [Fusobacterium sp. PH5-44]|uniref:SIMPL domain-containing protein n=1 Tax=unclassified Fusobacterium TaxID=2648384 RepID=UPI003D1D2E43